LQHGRGDIERRGRINHTVSDDEIKVLTA
jgi:hypothetical protein